MTIILTKGQNINLEKEAPNVQKFTLGLGWDEPNQPGVKFDLDGSLFLLDENGKFADGNEKNFVYYHNLTSPCGTATHTGDNTTGEGEGDDERIIIDFSKTPDSVHKLSVVINIFDAISRGQNFGQVDGASARIFNTETEEEICKFDLTEDHSAETALHMADFYRHNGEWKFKAIGIASQKTLKDFVTEFGGVA